MDAGGHGRAYVRVQGVAEGEAGQEAQGGSYHSQEQRLGYHEAANLGASGADRSEHADFTRTLHNVDREGVDQAERGRDDQSDQHYVQSHEYRVEVLYLGGSPIGA